MGNFRQHITCSTVTGIAVGGIAYHFGFTPPVCLVSAGLCSFAGMLPDIDSDTSKSFHECLYLTAGIGCMLTASRLRTLGLDSDFAMLGGAFMFLLIRFGLGTLIRACTVHRGMIHSIPMAILAGEIAFFVVTGTVAERLLKAAAILLGFLSHLILDEVYSIDSTGAKLRLKKSFGTALKWTNPKQARGVTVLYVLISCFGYAVISCPEVIEQTAGSPIEPAVVSPVHVLSPLSADHVPSIPDAAIHQEAAEYLLQQSAESSVSRPYAAVASRPANLEMTLFVRETARESVPSLPLDPVPAASLDNTWNPPPPVQPAPIMLP